VAYITHEVHVCMHRYKSVYGYEGDNSHRTDDNGKCGTHSQGHLVNILTRRKRTIRVCDETEQQLVSS